MKYLIRSVKYCIYLAIMLTVFIFVLVALKVVSPGIDGVFTNGARAVWQIAGILVVFSAIYPALGFGRRTAVVHGPFEEVKDGVIEEMHIRGYVLESCEGEKMTFRAKSPVTRLFRMFEDRVTMLKTLSGFELEGPVKDLVRVIGGLENRFRQ